jgi:hypothetical protein
MEKYIWSLDISTTNIGSAVWDSKGNLIELKHLLLKLGKDIDIVDRDLHKAEIFRKYAEELKERLRTTLNGELVDIIVEEPLGGSSNPTTASLLFGFNGICRYILHQIFGIYPMKISVHESRKLFCDELVTTTYKKTGEKKETLSFPIDYRKRKKLYIWEKVSKLEPQIEWFYKRNSDEPRDMCFDMADSYCVGYAGLIKMGIIEKNL